MTTLQEMMAMADTVRLLRKRADDAERRADEAEERLTKLEQHQRILYLGVCALGASLPGEVQARAEFLARKYDLEGLPGDDS